MTSTNNTNWPPTPNWMPDFSGRYYTEYHPNVPSIDGKQTERSQDSVADKSVAENSSNRVSPDNKV
jgi:hypothetical protein